MLQTQFTYSDSLWSDSIFHFIMFLQSAVDFRCLVLIFNNQNIVIIIQRISPLNFQRLSKHLLMKDPIVLIMYDRKSEWVMSFSSEVIFVRSWWLQYGSFLSNVEFGHSNFMRCKCKLCMVKLCMNVVSQLLNAESDSNWWIVLINLLLKSACRSQLYNTWDSSSTQLRFNVSRHHLHVLFSLAICEYRPFSISKPWALILSLVILWRWVGFLITSRYDYDSFVKLIFLEW